MKKPFEINVTFEGHLLFVDGYTDSGYMKLYHVYLSDTSIEISDSLTQEQHDELSELILTLI